MEAFEKQPVVALVDEDPVIHEFVRIALEPRCRVISFHSGSAALAGLPACQADLLLLDVVMAAPDGFETIRLLRQIPELADLPTIFLTAKNDVQLELKALALGAVDYIKKPFAVELLSRRLEVHLSYIFHRHRLEEDKQTLEALVGEKVGIIQELKTAIVFTLANMVEMRDNSTGRHVFRTQGYYRLILQYLMEHQLCQEELHKRDIEMLIEASQLHDIGKIGIPDAILLKPGKLTTAEFEVMKTHTQIGYEAILQAMEMTEDKEFLIYAAEVIIGHHERWDGSGYPRGLANAAIPLPGRIMAVVDVYDALISERPYKSPLSHKEAVHVLMQGRGTHFDPMLINAFLSMEKAFCKVSKT